MDPSPWREWAAADAVTRLAPPGPRDDKYSRGVLGVVTGSHDYPGAAVLGVEAASRSGVGMVRYIGPRDVAAAVLARRPETVIGEGRVQAWLLGSGMNPERRSFVLSGDLQHALASGVPVVLDAGALDLVGSHRGPTVITPHAGELARLLTLREVDVDVEAIVADRSGWAERAAHELGVAVLLKGAVTHVCDPEGRRYTITAATHRLATAGSGDVLAGILGALAAVAHADLDVEAGTLTAVAATAAFVHAEAARRATEAVDGGPVTALDIAEAVPAVVGALGQA
ncbi:NAD(P)H-hydrate dehydratase [Agromyces sp. MMS24-JH15]|uniref:ADP-dependent NAD(P)H-hydrate dehydratase n=1 Tax=Agromyces sp. MMS24-JH15 TaxID=3243765 RepID=UPI00374A2E7B